MPEKNGYEVCEAIKGEPFDGQDPGCPAFGHLRALRPGPGGADRSRRDRLQAFRLPAASRSGRGALSRAPRPASLPGRAPRRSSWRCRPGSARARLGGCDRQLQQIRQPTEPARGRPTPVRGGVHARGFHGHGPAAVPAADPFEEEYRAGGSGLGDRRLREGAPGVRVLRGERSSSSTTSASPAEHVVKEPGSSPRIGWTRSAERPAAPPPRGAGLPGAAGSTRGRPIRPAETEVGRRPLRDDRAPDDGPLWQIPLAAEYAPPAKTGPRPTGRRAQALPRGTGRRTAVVASEGSDSRRRPASGRRRRAASSRRSRRTSSIPELTRDAFLGRPNGQRGALGRRASTGSRRASSRSSRTGSSARSPGRSSRTWPKSSSSRGSRSSRAGLE